MNKNVKLWAGIIGGISSLLLIALGYYAYTAQKQLSELSEQYEIEKEEIQEEYTQLAIQYEGYKLNVNNDSLIDKLENERLKVQRLVEELKTTNATNARRIAELKKELSTVRTVLRTYVAQVDSLNRLNAQLTEENRIVTQKYQAATQTATQLKREKEVLTKRVDLASKLDAVAISAEAQTSRNKSTDKISRAEKIKICFTLAKNVTAPIGEKEIFIRIMKPDQDILVKNRSNLFRYENQEINYSIRKMVEYDGEESQICVYWAIEEFLHPGEYRADIFADGNLIGKKTFKLSK